MSSPPPPMGSMLPRRHSTDDQERFVHHDHQYQRSSNINYSSCCSRRRRMNRFNVAVNHHHHHHQFHPRNSSHVYDDDDDDHQFWQHHHSTKVPDQLDFHDVFGGPPCSCSSILLGRGRFSADHAASACTGGGTSTNFSLYDEIFCPAPHPHHHPPDPHAHHIHNHHWDRGISVGAGCFHDQYSQQMMMMMPRRRSSIRGRTISNINGRSLPGFSIPYSSSSSSPDQRRRTSEAEAEASSSSGLMFVRPEEGFYDDIFGSHNNIVSVIGRGSDDRCRSRTCTASSAAKSKSKSKASDTSTSVLSYEDNNILMPSPPHPPAHHPHHHHHPHPHPHHHEEEEEEEEHQQQDTIFSSFASKLRPIKIPTRSRSSRNRSNMLIEKEHDDQYDSSLPSPSTILSGGVDAEDVENSQRTLMTTIDPLSTTTTTTTFKEYLSSLSPPQPPSSDKKSLFNSNFFQNYSSFQRGCQPSHVSPSPDQTTELRRVLNSGGLAKPELAPIPPPAARDRIAATSTLHIINATNGRDIMCNYAPGRSPSSLISSLFLEPLSTANIDVAAAQAQKESIAEKKTLVQEEGETAGEGDNMSEGESDNESSFVKEIEYGNNIDHGAMRMMMGESTVGAAAVDEAIAWAKEKFWNGRGPAASVP